MDGDVRLRPVTEGDLEVVTRCFTDQDSAGEYHWSGWRDPTHWRRRWAEDGLLTDHDGHLMIVLGHDRLGLVSWHRNSTSPNAHCWAIGIALLSHARGHGYGARAQRLLVDYLFTHTPVQRVEAYTEDGNALEQEALEHAGFTREGVLRSYTFRAGAWRDTVVYSVLRGETGS
jgi:RimJ/RimL family protein N-acetyltransferase